MTIKLMARKAKKNRDAVEVHYECQCGCHPVATYLRGSADTGREHCCCGIVHFAGPLAEEKLRSYLTTRKDDGIDGPEVVYTVSSASLRAPWGDSVEVAYAEPAAR